MNQVFFSESQNVQVSRITADGWWLENTTEHVVKGTALGKDFTVNIYTPSKEGMIARYDRNTDTWSNEIKDRTFDEYFSEHGQKFVIGEPDGNFPDGAITEAPPEHNQETQTVLYKDDQWIVYDILVGKPFYDEYGNEFLVSDYNFVLPENHTFNAPPEVRSDKYAVKLVDEQWQQLLDYRGEMAYAKSRDKDADYQIEKLGELPDTHTLVKPSPFDSWIDNGWKYDIERHRPFKISEEKQWRDDMLVKVLNRIDQYEKDKNYPQELRTSPIQTESDFLKLVEERKILSDYPSNNDFPFGLRPVLSSLSS